jgi:hypothetical protein
VKWLRKITTKGFIILLVLTTAGFVTARGMMDGNRCYIAEDEVIKGDLFVLCGDLIIEGRVEGHVIGAARVATIHGQVEDSIYLLGGEMQMHGKLGKDLHFIGLVLKIEEETRFEHETGAILSANLTNTIQAGTTVPGNISNIGYQLIVDGDVGREINFWGSALNISGHVSGDVTATVGDSESSGAASQIETLLLPFRFDIELRDPGLIVFESSSIDGQLEYTGATRGIIHGNMASPERYKSTKSVIIGTPVEQSAHTVTQYVKARLNEFMSLMVVAAISLVAIPRQIQSPIKELQARPISTLGVGMLAFILSFPIVLLLAMMSLVFIFILSYLPLQDVTLFSGIVLLLANIGAASVFYFTAIYITRIVVALSIGRFIASYLQLDTDNSLRAQFINASIGLLLLSLLGTIPIIGKLITAIVLFSGLGGILRVVRAQIQRFRESSHGTTLPPPIHYRMQRSPRLPYYAEDAAQSAPPIIDDLPDSIGAGNLPEGFDWWGEEDD